MFEGNVKTKMIEEHCVMGLLRLTDLRSDKLFSRQLPCFSIVPTYGIVSGKT